MTNDIKNKGIGGISKTSQSSSVKGTNEVSSVDNVQGIDNVQKVSNVSGVGSVNGIRQKKNTRIITPEEREALFKMINEEAQDIFGKDSKRGKIASEAVKMAIDSAIIKED